MQVEAICTHSKLAAWAGRLQENGSVAEVDENDQWQSAELGLNSLVACFDKET